MADNTQIASGTGDIIADDDITDVASVAHGAKVQRVKAGFGVDGTYADVTTANPLPVAQQGTVTVDTELPAAAALADGAANPTAPAVAEYCFVWNGSTWDRVKSATAATGTSGTGVPAAGIVGYDGTSYRRILTDTNGNLQVGLSGPALSDLIGNPSSAASVGAYNMLWNGGTWDRMANPNQVNGSATGRGIAAAGMMAVNASGQWQQARSNSGFGYGVMVAPEYLELTQGFNAANQVMTLGETRTCNRVSFQLSGTWTGTFRLQGSNDNSNWYDYPVYNVTSAGPPVTTVTANGLYMAYIASKYTRLTPTQWSSGTASAYMEAQASVGGSFGATQVTPTPGTTGGWTSYFNAALSSTTVTPKSSQGVVGGYLAYNPNTTVTYLQGLSSGTYLWCIGIPPSSAANVEFTCGIQHAANIQVLASNTAGSAVAPTAAIPVTILYK